jgi:hypothetical protein
LGINKGRLHDILRIEQIIKQKGLRTFFYIVDEKEYRKYRKPRVSYETYLTWIDKSKCILDIVQEGQTGATLRVMESLFFNKKLLTTGKSIVNEDFYNSTNIFVIGQDSWESLHDFMTKPYQPVPEKIINKYEFKNWINRFSN